MKTKRLPIGEVIEYSAGGGWGKELPFTDSRYVAIVRGADFPSINNCDYTGIPSRYEKTSKVAKVSLRNGDIVLENSGGTDTRPTGRSLLVTDKLLNNFDTPIIPASFCRILRFDDTKVNPTYGYYWLQDMYNQGRTWSYQNRSTGLSNFQFKTFQTAEIITLPPMTEQNVIGQILASLDSKISANHQTNDYLVA